VLVIRVLPFNELFCRMVRPSYSNSTRSLAKSTVSWSANEDSPTIYGSQELLAFFHKSKS
jgi:hypothetical protein